LILLKVSYHLNDDQIYIMITLTFYLKQSAIW